MPTFVLEPDASPQEALEGVQDLFGLEPSQRAIQRITYLDTFDWRLWRRGLLFSSTSVGRGVRLTLRGGDGSVWEARAPRPPAFASELPRTPLEEVLSPIAGIRRLLAHARARWQSELFDLKNEDEKTVVRALVRRGEASAPGTKAWESVPPLLELLPLKGYEAELRRVVARLRRRFPMETGPSGELLAVLTSVRKSPGAYSSSFGLLLDPEVRTGEAARAIHGELLETMLVNLDGVVRDLDPEFLHDFRVAVRRTRTALAQIRGVFPNRIVTHYAQEFRWLGERTGPARDLDVYLLKIPAYRRALPQGATDELDPLVEFLRKKKRIAHRRMVRSLTSHRFERLMSGWRKAFEDAGADERPQVQRLASEVASERIIKAHRKLLKRGHRTDRKTSPETLHRLRIDCKKLRYLMTLFQGLFPRDDLATLVKETKRLQDALGDFNDLYVQRSALLSFAGEMMAKGIAHPATLMAMGQLMGGLEAQQGVERERFRESFLRFSRKKNQARFDTLFGGRPPPAADPGTGNASAATGGGPPAVEDNLTRAAAGPRILSEGEEP